MILYRLIYNTYELRLNKENKFLKNAAHGWSEFLAYNSVNSHRQIRSNWEKYRQITVKIMVWTRRKKIIWTSHLLTFLNVTIQIMEGSRTLLLFLGIFTYYYILTCYNSIKLSKIMC